MDSLKSNDIVRFFLDEKLKQLSKLFSAKALMLRAPMESGIDNALRFHIENLATIKPTDQKRIIVFLETHGGSVDVVERISDTLRHHFEIVEFVIPNFAYSAGTVLALSGDEIHMDYYSVMGPIDPQIRNKDGRWVPGRGYLIKYADLIRKSQNNEISVAELEMLVRKFDPAELFSLEQAEQRSRDLITRWLSTYKFKDWKVRQTSNEPVTVAVKKARAREIADLLSSAETWNSHGRGINRKVLDDLEGLLKIQDFGSDSKKNEAVRDYCELACDFCAKLGGDYFIHSNGRFECL